MYAQQINYQTHFFHLTTRGDIDEDAKMMMQKWKMSDIEEDEVMWIVVRDVLFLISTLRSLFGSLLLFFVDFDPSFIRFFKRKPVKKKFEILGNKLYGNGYGVN